ncbi:hypothetical protein AB4Y32_25295 [Paraburkholderia phymatum]|uniref:Uncharacterized protein n=1 Tax=Paraburkholderia phymatum TaxID=148447 RepID=A0ACC6U6F5_9BURK
MDLDSIKIMLKATVLTQLMHSLAAQDKHPTPEQDAVILRFNDELDAATAAGNDALEQPIEEVYLSLLYAVESLSE